jgi:hypothetical protein
VARLGGQRLGLAATGCRAMEGLGRDIERGGENLSNSAREHMYDDDD